MASTKAQLEATGESMPEAMLKEVSQILWAKTDCGDPEKLARSRLVLSPLISRTHARKMLTGIQNDTVIILQ